jgi:penicillin-binding protein 2
VYPRGQTSAQDRIVCKRQLDASFTDASRLVWRNWTRGDDGEVNLDEAFIKSCNTYFWDVALNIWEQHKETPREDMLQDWARAVGFGTATGIDLPFERSGIVPDRELFEQWGAEQAQGGPARLDPARLELATPWLGGDLLQASVGQGAVLATPLQLAVAYAAMTNGGEVYQPHVVSRVVNSDGFVVEENKPTVVRTLDLDPTTTLALRRAMGSVVNDPEGTAYSAFVDFGFGSGRVGGKTGTAQIIRGIEATDTEEGRDPVSTALFVAVAPLSSPEYVVVVVIERGGSGGRIAAAVAKPILQYLLNGQGAQTAVIPGEDSER